MKKDKVAQELIPQICQKGKYALFDWFEPFFCFIYLFLNNIWKNVEAGFLDVYI